MRKKSLLNILTFLETKKMKVLLLTILNSILLVSPIYASNTGGDVFAKAGDLLKTVYNGFLGITNVAAVTCAIICLFFMFFSKNQRTIEESKSWLKRIAWIWAIINSLGLIINYLTPLLEGGRWNG